MIYNYPKNMPRLIFKCNIVLFSTFFLRRLFLLFLFFISLSSFFINAQLPNGTLATQEYFDLVLANLSDESLEIIDTVSPELDVNLKLEVFIVLDDFGEPNFENETLISNLSIVNSFFKKIGIAYAIGNVTMVPEYEYSIMKGESEIAELDAKYSKQKRINLFLVDEIVINADSSYGFTTYPIDTIHNNIFIRKDYVFGNNLTALFGSFFGLLNTYESIGGQEFVDESNCLLAGDVICDTYADPGDLAANINDNCQYLGAIMDLNGEYFLPSVANIMSDSPDNCKCLFTLEQYRRMKFYYKNYRNYLN